MRPAPSSQAPSFAEGRLTCVARYAACLVTISVASSACGVDDRTLRTEGAAASGSAGAAGNPAFGGAAGMPEPEPLPRCTYVANDVDAGCETLVKNPGFERNVASWSAEPVAVTEGWSNSDASDDPKSGSLVVMNLNYSSDESAKDGTNGGGARQCITVTSGRTYDMAADIFIPMGQGAGFEGNYVSIATLGVFFYEDATCSGRTQKNFNLDLVEQTDEWVHVVGSTIAPKESQSMAVRLATLKPFRQVMFEARFDNVFVQERATP